jgi:subtilisin family serine protease
MHEDRRLLPRSARAARAFRVRRARVWWTPALALLAACGGAPPPVEVAPPGDEGAAPGASEIGTAVSSDSPWDAVADPESLARFVEGRALGKLAELGVGLPSGGVDAWLADPAAAPELPGRAVERLLDIAVASLARGQAERAERLVRLVRARARNRNSAFAATTLLAETRRRAVASAGGDASAQRQAVEATLRELPRARFGSATVIFQLFQTEAQVDAQVAAARQQLLALETASSALFYDRVVREVARHRDVFLAAVDAVRAEHAAAPEPAPYAFSTVDLTGARDARPVVVGVWDTGTEPGLFAQQLFTAPDGSHGVVSDPDPAQRGYVYDPGPVILAEFGPFLRGIMDLRAGLASTPDAQRVLALQRSITDVERLEEVERALDAVGEWAHGTHVAGILLAGVPQARLAIFRSAWAGEARVYWHRGPTDAELAEEEANATAVADFIRAHDVRVVNVSLGFSRDYLEDQLRHETERYPTEEAVQARAAFVHERRGAVWRGVFRACPRTLFVVAAGNSNRDVVEYGDVPAALPEPNALVVGAVDRFGGWATFTNSNPERVRVFDHGVEVDSLAPSGRRVPLSGTSMAAPNVANLAAKLVALDASLTPERLIAIITETGVPIAAPFYGVIAHEQRAVERVRRERPRSAPARGGARR